MRPNISRTTDEEAARASSVQAAGVSANGLVQRKKFDVLVKSQDMYPERSDKQRVTTIRDIANGFEPGTLLDIGCFDGRISAPLVARHRVSGIDISDGCVSAARERGIDARQGNVEDPLPFDDATFDYVLAADVLEHVVRTDFFLNQINRVMGLDGRLIVTTPNVVSLASFATMLLFDTPPYLSARYRSPHVRDFTGRTLRLALKNNGFAVERVLGLGLGSLGSLIPRFARFGVRFAPLLIVVARKVATPIYDEDSEWQLRLIGS